MITRGRRSAVLGVVLGSLSLLGCQHGPAPDAASPGPAATRPAASSSSTTSSQRPSSQRPSSGGTSGAGGAGLPTCALIGLPREAGTTVQRIHSGGPFPYPRNDGVVFGNRERELPQEASGYYREYTVPTPGARTRGTRRIITAGRPLTDPLRYYYTGDHYESFCTITGAGGR